MQDKKKLTSIQKHSVLRSLFDEIRQNKKLMAVGAGAAIITAGFLYLKLDGDNMCQKSYKKCLAETNYNVKHFNDLKKKCIKTYEPYCKALDNDYFGENKLVDQLNTCLHKYKINSNCFYKLPQPKDHMRNIFRDQQKD